MYFFALWFESFLLIFSFHFSNFIYLICNFITSHLLRKSPSIDFRSLFSSGFKAFKAPTYFIPSSTMDFTCFSNALLSVEYENLSCSVILL